MKSIRKKNFVIANFSETFGGQERFAEILCASLDQRGWDTAFIGGPSRISTAKIRAVEPFFFRKTKVESVDIDVVVLNGNRTLYKSAIWRKGKSFWIYVQHSDYRDRQANSIRLLIRLVFLRVLIKRVDAVVRVSSQAIPETWAKNRVSTIHNGIELRKFPLKGLWRHSSGQVINFLMVGAINVNKNQKLAIELLKEFPRARLILVGEGPEASFLKRYAMENGLWDRVEFAGNQRDTSSFYQKSDVCLMLSRYEAMPLVVLEAMASGTPVAGFPVGGVGEVIENGVDGVLVEERTPEALANAIKPLVDEPERLKEMGLKARAKIEKSFTDERMADEFEQLIGELCGGNVETRG